MAQGYTLLGYDELADNSVAVLRDNFPDHPALDSDGNFERRQILAGESRSFLNRVSFGLLDRPRPLGFDTRELYNPEYQDNPTENIARVSNGNNEENIEQSSSSLQ